MAWRANAPFLLSVRLLSVGCGRRTTGIVRDSSRPCQFLAVNNAGAIISDDWRSADISCDTLPQSLAARWLSLLPQREDNAAPCPMYGRGANL